ncbi:hypothetical protein FCL47_07020 [Desulfopila sp. IMCC35006]|uniref:Mth938-like domain-containing protein n=1 Tax=Desulfopila sp. IMCC35006 TaxID=2569542 RepID=UPI0010AC26D4|nr:MTH938/NDUFAF3 family protein [Desulfopila sp. IMCC35006]TKB26928.1 hypothetical protein FCL47_07020 [Desulfopila sp. IMCC35006]
MEEMTSRSPRILSSGWGNIEVEILGRGKDFKLWPGGGRSWDWTEYGTSHNQGIQPGDVEEFIAKGCQVVVLTTGRLKRLKVPQTTIDALSGHSIEVVVASTKKAIQIYNEYVAKGVPVGGLFHSTC